MLASLTTVGLAFISGGLAVQASAKLDLLWLLYVLAAIHAALSAISGPIRRTFIPGLLLAEQLAAGMALNRQRADRPRRPRPRGQVPRDPGARP